MHRYTVIPASACNALGENKRQACLKLRAREIMKVLQSVAHKKNLRYESKFGDCELFIFCDIRFKRE